MLKCRYAQYSSRLGHEAIETVALIRKCSVIGRVDDADGITTQSGRVGSVKPTCVNLAIVRSAKHLLATTTGTCDISTCARVANGSRLSSTTIVDSYLNW